MRRVALGVLLLLVVAGCGSGHSAVGVHVTPTSSIESEPVAIRVTGLKPHERTTLRLTATDAHGSQFASSASFVADGHGVVDTTRAVSLPGGTYSGVWRDGLIASLTTLSLGLFYWPQHPSRFAVTVTAGGKQVTRGSFDRQLSRKPLAIRQLTVAHDGILGTFVYPVGAKPGPALLQFGGSEGGAGNPLLAGVVAASGIPTLTLGYFNAPGVPPNLENIPLEYFQRALRWLDRQPQVDPKRVSVLGISRGSEAALLLGVHYPSLVHAVVAAVPSNVVQCGIHTTGAGGCIGPSWTLAGKPLPYTEQGDDPNPTDVPSAAIPVERSKGPILLVCAGSDDVWTSCPYAHAIVARLKARQGTVGVKLYAYPNALHEIGGIVPYEPGALDDVPSERAREAFWPHLLAFLRGA